MCALTQHAGLAEDRKDFRLTSRTVLLNPILRYLYWNMNHHIEHHMYPLVPFHNLPQLHRTIRSDLPVPHAGLLSAWREMLHTFFRQQRERGYFVTPTLPEVASAAGTGPGA